MILPPVASGAIPTTTVAQQYIDLSGVDPYSFRDDGKFRISVAMLQHLEQNGPTQKFCDANSIPDAIERPTVILEGLKRSHYEHGLCYCTVPTWRWGQDTHGNPQLTKPPPLKVFAVYVNPVGDDLFIIDWDWRIVGLQATGIPNRWQREFERIVWPTS